MNPFQSLRDYELYVYSLPSRAPQIVSSTLIVQRRGRLYADLTGELLLRNQRRVVIYERLAWDTGSVILVGYGYEVWAGAEKLYWYDSQPHPHDPALASTHPHHKHVPPDIRHNRVPAEGLSFTSPNLLFMVEEASRPPPVIDD